MYARACVCVCVCVCMCVCVCACVCTYVCVHRALVGMMMYNPETTEIAKPSELLNGVRAYMNVLQGLENYGQ